MEATVGVAHPRSQENCVILIYFVRYQTVTFNSLIYPPLGGRLAPTKFPFWEPKTRQEKQA